MIANWYYLEYDGYHYDPELGPQLSYLLKATSPNIVIDKLETQYLGDEPLISGDSKTYTFQSLPASSQLWKGFDVTLHAQNYHGDYQLSVAYHISSDTVHTYYENFKFSMPKNLGYGRALIPYKGEGYSADFDMVMFTATDGSQFVTCQDGKRGVNLYAEEVIHRIHPSVSYSEWQSSKTGDEWHYEYIKTQDSRRFSYVKLLTTQVNIGDKDPNPPTQPGDYELKVCVPAAPALYYLVAYNKDNQRAEFQMPVKVFTGMAQGTDDIAFNFPKEMLNNPPPTNVKAVGGNGKITVSWDPVNGASSYNLYIASQQGVKKSNYLTLPGGANRTGVTSPYDYTGLTNGVTWYVVVTAVTSSGESTESAEASAKPSGTTSGDTITNTLNMNFKLIPAGTFMMGSPDSDANASSSEKPQHQVTISRAFYMQTTEVTQGQWKALMGSNPSYFSTCGDNCPVEQVSWDDTQAFIQKLNQTEGTNKYRLPTEAEWEYAARAGSTTAFYNGGITNTSCSSLVDTNLDAIGWYCGNAGSKTHPVQGKQANSYGLYDMAGNVYEWCQDWYGTYPTSAVTDPTGPSSGSYRMMRGGSWSGSSALDCRSASRYDYSPGSRFSNFGFRLVREQ